MHDGPGRTWPERERKTLATNVDNATYFKLRDFALARERVTGRHWTHRDLVTEAIMMLLATDPAGKMKRPKAA